MRYRWTTIAHYWCISQRKKNNKYKSQTNRSKETQNWLLREWKFLFYRDESLKVCWTSAPNARPEMWFLPEVGVDCVVPVHTLAPEVPLCAGALKTDAKTRQKCDAVRGKIVTKRPRLGKPNEISCGHFCEQLKKEVTGLTLSHMVFVPLRGGEKYHVIVKHLYAPLHVSTQPPPPPPPSSSWTLATALRSRQNVHLYWSEMLFGTGLIRENGSRSLDC